LFGDAARMWDKVGNSAPESSKMSNQHDIAEPLSFTADAALSETQRNILDAAAACFSETGFEATSIDTIAERVGSTKGLIYYSYKSKSDLFFAVCAYALEITTEFVNGFAPETLPPETRIARMARAHLVLMMRKLPYHYVAKQGVEEHVARALTPPQRKKLRDIIEQRDGYEKMFRRVIAEGVQSGAFTDIDASIAAKTLLGGLNGVSTWYRPQPEQTDSDRERIVESVVGLLIGGLLRR
jgi:AcrR family transcriptional regulator